MLLIVVMLVAFAWGLTVPVYRKAETPPTVSLMQTAEAVLSGIAKVALSFLYVIGTMVVMAQLMFFIW